MNEKCVNKFRKKPVVIEAMQWFDDVDSTSALFEFCNAIKSTETGIKIKTPEGELNISKGDFVIKGTKGEFYPCKPNVFEEVYEKV